MASKAQPKVSKKIKSRGHGPATSGLTPQSFLNGLGIKPMERRDVHMEVRKLGLRKSIEALFNATDQRDATRVRKIMYSDLRLLKLVLCTDFEELQHMATVSGFLPIASNTNVLTVGRDEATVMAFGLAAFANRQVTCLHPYYQTGNEWAQEIGEKRVVFANASFSGLANLKENQFDAAFLPIGWDVVLGGGLPKQSAIPPRSSSEIQPANDVERRLMEFFKNLDRVIEPDGLFIMEDVHDPYSFGLFTNDLAIKGCYPGWELIMSLPFASQDRHGASLLFAKSNPPVFMPAVVEGIDKGWAVIGRTFYGQTASKIREIFDGAKSALAIEYQWLTNQVTARIEILKGAHAGLYYKSSSENGHIAVLLPKSEVPKQVRHMQSQLKGLVNQGHIKIIK